MKKIIVLFMLFFIGIANIYALDAEVESIEIKEKSDSVVVEDISINNLKINSDIVFGDVGDYVKFAIKLKDTDYEINSVSDNNSSEYLKTSYSNDGSLIYLTINYAKEPSENLSLNDIDINVTYSGSSNDIVNPKTFDNRNYIVFGLILISLIGLVVSIKIKSKFIVGVSILFLFIPALLTAEESIKISIVLKSDNIKVFGSHETFNNSLSYINKQNSSEISVGDEVIINSEHFYVISSNEEKTLLLSKYNLLVGNVFNWNDGKFTLLKTFNSSDKGYMLQSRETNSQINLDTRLGKLTGVVPFSGINYWDNVACPSDGNGETVCESGTYGIIDDYSVNNASYDGNPYPYVYDSNKASTEPSLYCMSETNGDGGCYANNNDYTIAYYVENYLSKLKSDMGLPNTASARLLSIEEIKLLKDIILSYDVDVDTCIVSGTTYSMNKYEMEESAAKEAAKTICTGHSLNGITLRGMINSGEIELENYSILGIKNVKTFNTEVKNYEFWLGSAYDSTYIWSSSSIDEEYGYSYDRSKVPGVRPLLIVNTSDI